MPPLPSRGEARSRRPLTVAITGAIAAGKTEALRAFARHGAATLSADEIVHRLLREDTELQDELFAAFGVRITVADAAQRAALADRVFGDAARVEQLERLLHPRVVEEQRRWLDAVRQRPDPPAVCAIEIPLLYETGAERRFDAVVVITAPKNVRVERKRLAAIPEREQRLLPDEEKIRRADYIYVNDGTLDELDAFVAGVVRELSARA
jgi:dephospho-CoA kinase